jgi:hypothetical protein
MFIRSSEQFIGLSPYRCEFAHEHLIHVDGVSCGQRMGQLGLFRRLVEMLSDLIVSLRHSEMRT